MTMMNTDPQPQSHLTRSTPEAKLRAFIADSFFFDGELDAGQSLTDSGVVDSTGILELVTFLEDELGVEVDDADIVPENLDSLASILAFVGGRANAA